jgi:hypothetical protein
VRSTGTLGVAGRIFEEVAISRKLGLSPKDMPGILGRVGGVTISLDVRAGGETGLYMHGHVVCDEPQPPMRVHLRQGPLDWLRGRINKPTPGFDSMFSLRGSMDEESKALFVALYDRAPGAERKGRDVFFEADGVALDPDDLGAICDMLVRLGNGLPTPAPYRAAGT